MSTITPFPTPDLSSMDRDQLKSYLQSVHAQMAQLDAEEPEDMNSEEYDAWGDHREELEDLADEIMDLLNEL